MRDVNNGWIIRYLHCAPCDSVIEQMWFDDKISHLILLLIMWLIIHGIGKQIINGFEFNGRSRLFKSKRSIYVEDNELDTPSWAKYTHSILSRIRRLSLLLFKLMSVVVGIIINNNSPFIRVLQECEQLNIEIFDNSKPRELTASILNMRSRSDRSNTKDMKDHSREKSTFLSSSENKNDTRGPDFPNGKRPKDSSFRWLMEKLNELKKKAGKYNGIINIISDPEFLYAAYLLIKNKPGNMTKGISKITLDGINWEYFKKISSKLIKGQFEFSPARRVEIPKKSGGFRPLSIGSPREKIVQKAIALILEAIFEPLFSRHSHGFRPNKSVHTALKEIYLKGGNYTWSINGDITKCFDNIPHEVMMKIISQKIACNRTLELIKKLLRTPTITDKGNIIPTSGTPQGNVASPILANIVLNEFDKFINKKIGEFETGKVRKVNREYHNMAYSRYKYTDPVKRALLLKKIMNMNPKDPSDPNFKRMFYTRYADDFVILLICSQIEAYTIRRTIKDFLKNKLGLELNLKKTSIINIKKGFKFLGAEISRREQVIRKIKRDYGQSNLIRRRVSRRLVMNAPLKELIKKLIENKMAKINHKANVLATSRKDLVNHSHYQILQFFNYRINGLLSFYSFAANFSQMRRVIWIIEQSCALTLALKYKLKTMRQVFIKFGRNLKDQESEKTLVSLGSMKVKHDYKGKNITIFEIDRLLSGSPHMSMTIREEYEKCALCDSTQGIEMHHLRKVKDIRQKIQTQNATYEQWTGGFLRKQVPLCSLHHQLLHKGKLNKEDMNILSKWTRTLPKSK